MPAQSWRSVDKRTDEIQLLEALRTNRQKRERQRRFVVEGVRNIDAAVAHGWTITTVLTVAGARRSRWADETIERIGEAERLELAPDVFDLLTVREERPELLVVSGTASLVVTMLIEMGVLCAILLLAGNMVLPWIPVLILLIAIEAVFVFGCALVLYVCNVYFRDVQYLVAIALQVIFYTVPIVYPIRFVPVHATVLGVEIPLLRIYSLNPLVRFVGAFRDVLYDLRFPPLWDLAYITLWAICTLLVGYWVFGKLGRRLAEEV